MPTRLPFALAVALVAAACAPAIPPPRPLPPPPPPTAIEQAVAQADDGDGVLYTYSPVGKRDPFRDLTLARGGTSSVVSADVKNRKLTALQKFEIDQLRLQFTVTGTSSPMAMVVDPTARGHVVHIGDFLGKNWGKVSHIGREEVTVTETIADNNTGRVYPVYIPLRMPKTEAEKKIDESLTESAGRPL